MYTCRCGLRWVSLHDRETYRRHIPCLCGRTIIAWEGTFFHRVNKLAEEPGHITSRIRLPTVKM